MKKIFFVLFFFTSSILATEMSFHPAVTDGVNVWAGFDLLYWKSWEKALVATNRLSNVYTTDDFTQTSLVHPHSDWDLGYRLDCGYIFSKNHLWDIEGNFLHYASFASYHKASGNSYEGMFPIWSLSSDVISGDYVFGTALNWKSTLNMADIQAGRCFSFFDRLYLKPFFGLRLLCLDQHGHVNYKGGMFLIGIVQPEVSINGTDYINMENNYWGMGPRVGMQGQLHIKKGVGLSGLAAIAFPYGSFYVKQKEVYLNTVRYFHQEHIDRFCWVADFSGGVYWKMPFLQDRCAFTIGADWEYHLFLHQFELKRDAFDLVPKNRNFSTKGVTFSVRFDF